ncbi:MAG: phenylacetate-CoA oxygenase subunit PaaJ, partial [Flavobacterium sp.]
MINLHPNIDAELIPILEEVAYPEIPVLTVLDLGVIREAVIKNGKVIIKLTP